MKITLLIAFALFAVACARPMEEISDLQLLKRLLDEFKSPSKRAVSPSHFIGSTWRFRSSNYPGRYLRHRNWEGWVDTSETSDLFVKDSTFRVTPGLDCSAGGVSLESVNYPGHYLRHSSYNINLNVWDSSALYAADATFKVGTGLSGTGVSFESSNYPNHFIRHSGFRVKIGHNDNSNLFKADASWLEETGGSK